MISPRKVRRYIKKRGAGFGKNVLLPEKVDIRNCEEFFGTRCSYNVHVKGPKIAHIDKVDPRKNPLGHLKHDVGIPYTAITTSTGIVIGGLISKTNRKKGILVGGLLGLAIGIIADSW